MYSRKAAAKAATGQIDTNPKFEEKKKEDSDIDSDLIDDEGEVNAKAQELWQQLGQGKFQLEFDDEEDDGFGGKHNKDEARQLKMKTYGPEDEPVEYADGLDEIFHKVPPGEGDETMAVKPWVGAVKKPDPEPKNITKFPDE